MKITFELPSDIVFMSITHMESRILGNINVGIVALGTRDLIDGRTIKIDTTINAVDASGKLYKDGETV